MEILQRVGLLWSRVVVVLDGTGDVERIRLRGKPLFGLAALGLGAEAVPPPTMFEAKP